MLFRSVTVPPAGQGVGYPFYWAKPQASYLDWSIKIDNCWLGAPTGDRSPSLLYYSNGWYGDRPLPDQTWHINQPAPVFLEHMFAMGGCGAGYVTPGYES